jgi:capsular exopolysaccharide synthesis family protein
MFEDKERFEEEVHLRDYLRVIFKRRWIIITVFVILVTTVTIGSFKMDPIYQATTQVLIDRENPKVVNIEEVLGVNTTDKDYYQTQYEILKSKSLALKVIKTLNLDKSSEFISEKGEKGIFIRIKKLLFPVKENNNASSIDSKYNGLIKDYLGRLKIEPIRNSRLVNIKFEGKDPILITKIANTHAKLYIEESLERKFSASKYAVGWLSSRIKEVKKKLEHSELALQDYKKKNNLVSVDFEESYNINIQKLNDLNAALTKAKTERIEKENIFKELKRISKNPDMIDSMPAVVSNYLIQQLKAEYIKLSGRYQELSQKYGPKHPKMVRLSSEIKEIKRKIRQEVKKIAKSIETEYRVAKAKEGSIIKALEEQKRKALFLNEKEINYNVLKREVESNRALYESLLKRMKEASLTEGLNTSNIMIVDPARIPDNPVKPKKRLNILLAMILGIFIGIGLAFFFEYLDNTIKTPEEVERYIGIPLLGIIGKFKKATAKPESEDIVALSDPKSNISEGFRTIRTNILFSAADMPKRVFLITSTAALEGKTTIATNLAVIFAQAGKKVLLIDSDMRRPKIHEIFGIRRSPGFSEVLVGESQISSVINNTKLSTLKVIPCGTIPPNPAELLVSQTMKELIQKAKERFDTVILDSPPIASVTDATELSTLADGVVMIIKSGVTPRDAIKKIIHQLSEINAPILGCILNAVDFKKEGYYYPYYQYYYKYYYGKEEKETKI